MRKQPRKHGPALWTLLPGAKVTVKAAPKRIASVSAGRRKRLAQYSALKKQWLRVFHADGRCECGCGRKAAELDVHHSRGRIGSLLLDWRHWKALRRECHDWVAAHPTEARERGLICDPGLWNVPDKTPTPELPARKERQ